MSSNFGRNVRDQLSSQEREAKEFSGSFSNGYLAIRNKSVDKANHIEYSCYEAGRSKERHIANYYSDACDAQKDTSRRSLSPYVIQHHNLKEMRERSGEDNLRSRVGLTDTNRPISYPTNVTHENNMTPGSMNNGSKLGD